MITDARAQVDPVTARRLEDLFKMGYFGSVQGISDTTNVSGTASTASLRAAANVATWRTYLPEDCVAAMMNDGWHLST
jgi:hypothetical protein